MKTILLTEEGRTQLVLTPETEHDRSVLVALDKLPNSYRCQFVQTRGGYTHSYRAQESWGTTSDDRDMAIVFDDPPPAAPPQLPEGCHIPSEVDPV